MKKGGYKAIVNDAINMAYRFVILSAYIHHRVFILSNVCLLVALFSPHEATYPGKWLKTGQYIAEYREENHLVLEAAP